MNADFADKCKAADTIVDIDIKPGPDPNCFNNEGNGVITVVILGSSSFDVSQVDTDTVRLAGVSIKVSSKKNPTALASIEEVNGDLISDMGVKIEDIDGTFVPGDTTATLTGKLIYGTEFGGTGSICIVP